MLARDFPSIEAVPDATFGEFQEVRLPEPRTPQQPPPPPRRPTPTPRRPSPTPRRPAAPTPTQRRPPSPPPPQTSPAPPRNNSPFTNFGQTPAPTRLPPGIGSPAPGRFSGSGGVTGGGTGGGSGLNILLTAGERREILDKLLGRDINSIVLTPLQRLAILQENQARQSLSRPGTFQTTARPGPAGPSETPRGKTTTRRPPAPRRTTPAFRPAAIRQENFQTTFRPRLQTTVRPGLAFPCTNQSLVFL